MTLHLVPGQNAPLAHRVLRFAVSGEMAWDTSALVVGQNLVVTSSDDFVFYNQPDISGVHLRPDGVHIDFDGMAAQAHGVLCIVSADAPTSQACPMVATLSDPTGAIVADFAMTWDAGQGAVICLELYRRAAAWKVRAIGQGYAGGLPKLLTAHGVEVDDSDDVGARVSEAVAPVTIEPMDFQPVLERLEMIFEDAARSTAALLSAREYAASRLDDELSAALVDPAMRTGPVASQARAHAQHRHDEVVLAAETRYAGDAAQLTGELAAIDHVLPRSLASWQSASWQSPQSRAVVADGIRVGEVSAPECGSLTVPFGVSFPLQRPLWIDAASPAAAAPVVIALVLRMLAASPAPAPILDVIDLTGALQGLTGRLDRLMGGAAVRSHHEVSAKLADLVRAADLAELGVQSGLSGVDVPARVVVLSDFGHGLQVDDLTQVATLAAKGSAARLSLVIVGDDESTSPDPLLRGITQFCRHVPVSAGDARVLDPWTRNEWHFTPDSMAADGDPMAWFLSSLAAP